MSRKLTDMERTEDGGRRRATPYLSTMGAWSLAFGCAVADEVYAQLERTAAQDE